MAIFTSPRSLQNAAHPSLPPQFMTQVQPGLGSAIFPSGAHSNHPSFFHLVLLVFEAVLEVVCVSLPGYFAAKQGLFDADAQKLVANLNVTLFTPCLIFTKLGSQLTAEKLTDLAIIPAIFIVQTFVSYSCAFVVSRCLRLKKRPSNFVAAMAVFGNSNSLPISLVMSLSQTLQGLHWDRIPNDNDDEVAARGILYLLIFQQLGQLVRWSWGYHVLLAPKERYLEEGEREQGANLIGQGQERYTDNPEQIDPDEPLVRTRHTDDAAESSRSVDESDEFTSGQETPVSAREYPYTKLSPHGSGEQDPNDPTVLGPPPQGPFLPRQSTIGDIMCFPNVEVAAQADENPTGVFPRFKKSVGKVRGRIAGVWNKATGAVFRRLPVGAQKALKVGSNGARKFAHGLWDFMNPPLWAMLISIVVASVPSLQALFFDEGTFVRNSVTRAISQNGQVAVPLILVVLGANLERNTLPKEALEDVDHPAEEKKLIIASLVARMALPTLIMAPILALLAKYVPVSILDDPIFIIVCFLLTGAPSALQLAQICQINNVYVSAMSKLLFQSYVVWILPSTLFLVMCALEVVEWSSV
ncbi:Auxin Efflux Carrier superfamily [Aspergillus saccharolyticus JOP 1030-1]|uniref:Auxin efflux transporter family protein n=1 Tax=Aspergillus saccharolyticus JOP 1030-1 TaxID=1450539 RepID=A0A318ZDZ6_9EURO|nr:auxin efflux transporter family protein [Aspergillus saccharolyticus JOP 1030-1]PYH45741.1 auxin efflux transporter family protein [Aspergillus saccharolyticus JOP 1030-1]